MADRPTGLTPDERSEIDEAHRRLGAATHYELLGLVSTADAAAVARAHAARARRFSPESFSAPLTVQYMQRVEEILEALDVAHAVLSDPVRRYLYDQELAQKSVRPPPSPVVSAKPTLPGATPTPLGAAPARRTPPHGTAAPTANAYAPPAPPTAIAPRAPTSPGMPAVPPSDPLGALEGLRGPAPVVAPEAPRNGAARAPVVQPRAPTPVPGTVRPPSPSKPPPAPEALEARVQALEAQLTTTQTEVSTLLAEVERLAVSVQLAIAYALEPGSVKAEQLVHAGQALVSSRVTVASLLARREEASGRWEAAATLWQRASRARPGEVMLLVHAANALRKAGSLDEAEAVAKQAIELDPDCAEAHAALAVIASRRA